MAPKKPIGKRGIRLMLALLGLILMISGLMFLSAASAKMRRKAGRRQLRLMYGGSGVDENLLAFDPTSSAPAVDKKEHVPGEGAASAVVDEAAGATPSSVDTLGTAHAPEGGCSLHSRGADPWPFYKVMKASRGDVREYPAVGWLGDAKNLLTLDDARFRSDFRFYIHDDGVFNTSQVEDCYLRKMGIKRDLSNVDWKLPVFKRMYLAEPAIWPVLRTHALRTWNPEEASLFVVGFSPFLTEGLTCPGFPSSSAKYEAEVVKKLSSNKWYQRKGGFDHMIFFMRFGMKMGAPVKQMLDSGSLVVTTDRLFWNVVKVLPNIFKSNSVVMAPYVTPYYLDTTPPGEPEMQNKHNDTWYFFAGTYSRRFGGRGKLAVLAEHLSQGFVNFTDLRVPKTITPNNGLLQHSHEIVGQAVAGIRRSSVCMSPQGDAVTSGRLFEAMAGGCVPVMIAPKEGAPVELPFPSLIDWDSVALFTDNFDAISKVKDGINVTGRVMEELVGPKASAEAHARLRCMQRQARRVFVKHLSYMQNPLGLTDSILLEVW
eukprot:CAMPEP_0173463458 /NCGR_PEP_ID=MMETSP1357-20121228/68300_1 /TAXON_ID=77926 /ORGANISM="Hemiselmis rufescens, Strain PCC563" /LENGTH=541 /DNA_ID=CAMNT_0014431271 /DNA_START=144 /DNA_END=1766 /DNA_ORIENTATION=-